LDKSIHPLQNWIPYKLTYAYNEPQCHWLNTFDKAFTEPFFDETIAVCKGFQRQRFPVSSVSDVTLLTEWSQNLNYVKPTAFIFHVSRCGSTLVSQLLGMDEQNISLAEVPFFDDLLRLPYKNARYNMEECEQLLKASLKFYGQKKTGTEKNLFVKNDSWHVFFYKNLRKLYPDVPFILLYRSPEQVLNSHKKQRGLQAVPGLIEPQLFGFNPPEVLNMPLDHYMAKVLERYFSLYLEIAQNDKLSLLLNYNEGIMPIIQKIASFSNTAIGEDNLFKMQQRSGYHSKHPHQVFSETNSTHIPEYLQTAFQLYKLTEEKRLAMLV
jgi:hypothetical protein